MDRSVTFWHDNNEENESWIMLIYSNLKNLFPKWVWCGGLSPHRCASCWCEWFLYLLLLPVEYCSWFYIITRCILLSILSWPMITTQYVFLVLTPTCMFLFVICRVQQTYHRLRLVRNSSQSSVYQNSGWATVSSSDWTLSFTSWCLEVRTWTISFTCFSFLNTLRFINLRIDVLDVMTSRFWEW